MKKPLARSVILELPPLSDAVAVQLLDSLYDFVSAWENCYGDQIRRYYAQKCRNFAPVPSVTGEQQMNLFDETDLPPF